MAKLDKTKFSQEILNKYQNLNNSLKQVVKNNDKDRIEVVIGDDKQEDFKPQFKMQRWDNEVNFSIRAEEEDGATIKFDGEVTRYIGKNKEINLYDKSGAGEDGGYEFEIILKEKPKTNIIISTIETKGLKFYKQLKLTDEEIERGCIRPDNVIDSYAVYHKSKGVMNDINGMEYKSGKAFHIYRVEAIDNNGNKVWCDQEIDLIGKYHIITIPQEFLDNAVYPIIVDPTFGYTSAGASTDYFNDVIHGSKFTGIAGTGNSMSMYTAGGPSNPYGMCIYIESTSGKLTNGQTNTSTIGSEQWETQNFVSSPTFTAVDYVLCINFDLTVSSGNIKYDTGDTNQGYYVNQSYGTWASSYSFSNNNNKYSIYATYTESGSSASVSPSSSISPSSSVSPSVSPSASVSPSSSVSPSVSPSSSVSSSVSPSASVSPSSSISPSVSPSASISPSVSPSSSISPSSSVSPSVSPSSSISPSVSPSSSVSPSVSPSSSISPSVSPSASVSPSSSISPSVSPSASISPSSSVSPSVSPSSSLSLSVSPSSSLSASISPSASVSPSSSLSASVSPSSSNSPSESPSPSVGYEGYTRGDYAALPSDDTDLHTAYSAQDYIDVNDKDDVRVSQTSIGEFAIHQFKDFISTAESINLEWEGQTNLNPSSSTVYLQIYNRDINEWETVDSNNTSSVNTDFILSADIANTINYKDDRDIVSCRVYQLSN